MSYIDATTDPSCPTPDSCIQAFAYTVHTRKNPQVEKFEGFPVRGNLTPQK